MSRSSLFWATTAFCWVAALLILTAVVMVVVIASSCFRSSPGHIFTVNAKESVSTGRSSTYLVYTDVTTYEITDSFLHWRFDSSDVYGRLKVGVKYTCTLQGRRIPFMSMYQNIIDPIEVTDSRNPLGNK